MDLDDSLAWWTPTILLTVRNHIVAWHFQKKPYHKSNTEWRRLYQISGSSWVPVMLLKAIKEMTIQSNPLSVSFSCLRNKFYVSVENVKGDGQWCWWVVFWFCHEINASQSEWYSEWVSDWALNSFVFIFHVLQNISAWLGAINKEDLRTSFQHHSPLCTAVAATQQSGIRAVSPQPTQPTVRVQLLQC